MKNIVFVLGAGASCPFGFPLGNDLTTEIIKGIKEVNYEDIWRSFRTYEMRDEEKEDYDFLSAPYSALYSEIVRCDNNSLIEFYGAQNLREKDYHSKFAEVLNENSSATIDSILFAHEKYSFIGRLYIALEILKAYFHPEKTLEQAFENGSAELDYDRYKKTSKCHKNNWYASLANYIKSFGGNAASLKKIYDINPIKIVTFNYDMSLEYYFRNSAHLGFDAPWITENIFHVYGCVDANAYTRDHARVESNYLKLLFEQANKISLIRKDSDENKDISKHIKGADVICILGFGFDKDNRNVIYLDPNMIDPRKKIYVHNYEDYSAINKLIREYPTENIKLKSKCEIKELFEFGFISDRIVL